MTRKTLAAATTTLAAGLVISAGMLYAQQQEGETRPDRMSQMDDMMAIMESCPMMQMHMAGPAAVLRHRQTLELSASQIREMESLRNAAQERRGPAMEAMRQAHEDLARGSGDAGFDEARARAALDRMAKTHTEMALGMLRDRDHVREILTPEQSAKLDELGSGMMDMMQMMMRMMRVMGSDSMGGMHMRRDTAAGGAGMADMGMMTMEDCPMMQHGSAGGE